MGHSGWYDMKAIDLPRYKAALMAVYESATRERGIIERHWAGHEPSWIDKDMLLPNGTARNVIATAWAEVKALPKNYFKD